MTLDECKELIEFARTPIGNRHLKRLSEKLEAATKALYYETDDGKLRVHQGTARTLFEQLQEYERANTAFESGNTN